MSLHTSTASQRSHVDLVDFVDWSGVECLNQSPTRSIVNVLKQEYREADELYLESDADEQLLIYIPFKQIIKLHSIIIKGPNEDGPRHVKLFANKEHMGFSNVNDFPASDSIVLSSDHLKGKTIILKYVKFQNVRRRGLIPVLFISIRFFWWHEMNETLTIFVENNQSDEEITKIQKIGLLGTTVETTDMKGLKKIEEH